jgi:hypothetical protein
MPQYVVFAIDDDEGAWEQASDETRNETYAADQRFGKLLEERGGRIVGGADLSHSRDARVLTKGGDAGVIVTEGPYAETVEQISGFFIVECDDYETVVEAARLMLEGHNRLEIRPRPVREQS